MTEATYRKKALPHLMLDFEGKCAYCLDPKEFRKPSQSHVDHFDCKIHGRKRHYYRNLMLACATCNTTKHDKPVVNPLDTEQRMFNCTEENEFLGHIQEQPDGQWTPTSTSKAAVYHLETIGLTEDCHKNKRKARRVMAERILSLATTAVQYKTDNPAEVHRAMMSTIRDLLDVLKNFPPLVTQEGIFSAEEWLKTKGVDSSLIGVTTVK